MNWEAIGAVGEMLGALGVIATLGYLAVQIRQNTRAVRSNTSQAITDSRVEFLASVTDDADVARIFYSGLVDCESLEGTDRGRFSLLMARFTATMENYFYQHRQGSMDTEQWTRMLETLRFFFATPGGQYWWKNHPIRPDVPFERFLDEEVKRILSSPELGRQAVGWLAAQRD